jgi:hypothetical protein
MKKLTLNGTMRKTVKTRLSTKFPFLSLSRHFLIRIESLPKMLSIVRQKIGIIA